MNIHTMGKLKNIHLAFAKAFDAKGNLKGATIHRQHAKEFEQMIARKADEGTELVEIEWRGLKLNVRFDVTPPEPGHGVFGAVDLVAIRTPDETDLQDFLTGDAINEIVKQACDTACDVDYGLTVGFD